jgi:hypothetical protein
VLGEAHHGPAVTGLLRRACPAVRRRDRRGMPTARRRARGLGFAKSVRLTPFPLEFSLDFKMKVAQTLNTEVVQQVTISKMPKGLGCYSHLFRQERALKVAKNSAPVNRSRTPSQAFFTKNSFEFQMPINSKVVSLNILHIFPFGSF